MCADRCLPCSGKHTEKRASSAEAQANVLHLSALRILTCLDFAAPRHSAAAYSRALSLRTRKEPHFSIQAGMRPPEPHAGRIHQECARTLMALRAVQGGQGKNETKKDHPLRR
jgi:hypothetical protein